MLGRAPAMSIELRAEHDLVLNSLSTRESTLHYAHCAVSLFVSIILFSTAAKLWWDFWIEHPEYSLACAAAGGVAIGYSMTRFFIGHAASGRENVQLVRLLDLRKTLGVDAPLSLS